MLLREFLIEFDVTVAEFSRHTQIHRNVLYSLMRNELCCTLNNAITIQNATDGEVTVFELPLNEHAEKCLRQKPLTRVLEVKEAQKQRMQELGAKQTA